VIGEVPQYVHTVDDDRTQRVELYMPSRALEIGLLREAPYLHEAEERQHFDV